MAAVVAAVLGRFVSLASAALFFALPCCGKTTVGEEEDTWLVSQPPPSARARDKEPGNYSPYSAVEGGSGRRAAGEGQPVCTMCLEVLVEGGDVAQGGRGGAGVPPPTGLPRAVLDEDQRKCPMCRGRGRIVPASERISAAEDMV